MPEAIGDYKILSPLGTSGLGDEYRARDTRVGRTVTLILLSPSISEDPDKFTALMLALGYVTRDLAEVGAQVKIRNHGTPLNARVAQLCQ